MALYHSTSMWFEAPSCKVTPVGRFHHLNYSMQNCCYTDVLPLGTRMRRAGFSETRSHPPLQNFAKADHLKYWKTARMAYYSMLPPGIIYVLYSSSNITKSTGNVGLSVLFITSSILNPREI